MQQTQRGIHKIQRRARRVRSDNTVDEVNDRNYDKLKAAVKKDPNCKDKLLYLHPTRGYRKTSQKRMAVGGGLNERWWVFIDTIERARKAAR